MAQRQFFALPPLALYVHIPWCLKKCPYCDFNSHNQPDELPEAQYIQALLDDLALELPDIWGRQLSSIFIGGGTPSLFSAKSLDTLLSGIRSLTAFSPDIEVTMEANPGTFEQHKFADFRSVGINRLSIGIQSFNSDMLTRLGRVHDAGEARGSIDIARDAGFDNLNLDLMFALPGQSRLEAAQDLATALSTDPEHVSYYQLTIEPNTLFAHNPPVLPEHELAWEMQQSAIEQLERGGWNRYEVSAYAKKSKPSVHNLNYWSFGDYVGIGAGAHGKISFADRGEIRRRWKQKHPVSYMESANSKERLGGDDLVPIEDTGLEFMMNALRLVDGFEMPLFQQHTGTDLQQFRAPIDSAINDGLLEQEGLVIRPTAKGFDFLNELLDRFLPDESQPQENQPLIGRYPVIPLLKQ